jgi:hypothetical protein
MARLDSSPTELDLGPDAAGEISTEHPAAHVLPSNKGLQGYTRFKNRDDGCVRAVFQPSQ